jgi:uncharacterized protein
VHRAEELVERLGLEVLEGESGWWAPITRSSVPVTAADGAVLAASSTIYYLLSPERPVNVWHWLAGDDVQVLVEGGPVDYVVLPSTGEPRRHVLGRLGDGHDPAVVAPGGSWKGLRLLHADGYALMVSTVTPAWAPDRVRIGMPADTAATFVGTAPWLTAELIDAFSYPA